MLFSFISFCFFTRLVDVIFSCRLLEWTTALRKVIRALYFFCFSLALSVFSITLRRFHRVLTSWTLSRPSPFAVDEEEVNALMRGHVQCLRKDPRFKNSFLVSIVEANSQWVQASYINRIIAEENKATGDAPFHPMSMPNNEGQNRTGVTTIRKKDYGFNSEPLVRQKLVLFARGLVGTDPVAHMDIFLQQMKNMEYLSTEVKNPGFDTPRTTMSGKRNGQNDDMAMAFLMGISYSGSIMEDPAFINQCKKHGKTRRHPAVNA